MADKYRSSLEIQMKMLEALTKDEPHVITRILYAARITSAQASAYLADMEHKELLTREVTINHERLTRQYQLTAKGRDLLAKWMSFKEAWEDDHGTGRVSTNF